MGRPAPKRTGGRVHQRRDVENEASRSPRRIQLAATRLHQDSRISRNHSAKRLLTKMSYLKGLVLNPCYSRKIEKEPDAEQTIPDQTSLEWLIGCACGNRTVKKFATIASRIRLTSRGVTPAYAAGASRVLTNRVEMQPMKAAEWLRLLSTGRSIATKATGDF